MLAGFDASPQLSAQQLHALVWSAASAQWTTGHRNEAVLAGAKAVNSMLQAKLGRRVISEVKLIQEAERLAALSLIARWIDQASLERE